ncbi:MAG: hypothetical protein ACE5HD_00555 [Acidobacteriota bacterium]
MALNSRILLVPHFPALLLDERNGNECRIQPALREIGRAFRSEGLEVVVILSARWDVEGPFQVDSGGRHKTLVETDGVDLSLAYACDGWTDLAIALHDNGTASGLPVEMVHHGMDHGASVPVQFLFPRASCRVVPLSTSERSRDDLRRWGEIVRETCRGAGAMCAIMTGGSLSYDPAAYLRGEDRPGGVALDRAVLSRLEAGDWDGLAALPDDLLAGGRAHAGLRHLWFLEGVLGEPVSGTVLGYHRHPSVGSALVEFRQPAP